MREYVRDKRSPIPKSETVSRVMSANKAKNTGPELLLRKALYQAGIRGYRLHRSVSTASGSDRGTTVRPDIAFIGRKLAIFVHGCFWHHCPKCSTSLPKHNTPFWKAKFERNVERDARKVADLTAAGWTVVTFWECDLKSDLPAVVKRIAKALV
jgi:DNA mismatch endonuclease (patch repair protein)